MHFLHWISANEVEIRENRRFGFSSDAFLIDSS